MESENNYQEVKKFTKESPESQEERNQLAQDIKEKRREYFSNKGDLSIKTEELKKQMEQKEVDLAQAKEDMEALQESLDKSKEHLILRVFDFIKLRQLKEKVGVAAEMQAEIDSISKLILELNQQIADKQKLLSARESIIHFYQDKTAELQEYKREQEFRSAKNISETYKILFVHGLLHMRGVGNNSPLKDDGIDFETKLKILLGLEPTISTSAVKEGDTIKNMFTRTGVFLKNGIVRKAFPADAGTQVKSLYERSVNTYDRRIAEAEKKDIYGQVEGAISTRSPKDYNEFIIEKPEVAGIFVYLPSVKDPNEVYWDPNKKYFEHLSDETIVEVSQKIALPLYGLRDGVPCKVGYNEELRKLEYVKDIDRSEVLGSPFMLQDEQKKDMVKSVLTENSPFRSEVEEAIK